MKMILIVAIGGAASLFASSVRLATTAEHFHARKPHRARALETDLVRKRLDSDPTRWVPLRRPPTIAVDGPRRRAANVVCFLLRFGITNGPNEPHRPDIFRWRTMHQRSPGH